MVKLKKIVGIDVSKLTIDVYDGKKSYQFKNSIKTHGSAKTGRLVLLQEYSPSRALCDFGVTLPTRPTKTRREDA